jgi:uncharacterized low-complexity protein
MNMSKKPLAIVLGAAFALTGAAAHASVFQTSALSSGYMVAGDATKAGEAKCGEKKAGEAKCGEKKAGEAKCGEGKCGEKKKMHEGKCGEGKCGEKKAK